jgi:TolA-binding protein
MVRRHRFHRFHVSSAAFTMLTLLTVVPLAFATPVAADSVDDATSDDPNAALRRLQTANGLLGRGLYDLAADEYGAFLKDNAGHADAASARYGIGVCLYRLRRFDEAADQLDHIASDRKFEFAAEAAVILGQCRLLTGDMAAAATAFERVVRRYETHDLADDAAAGWIEALYRAGQFDDAVKQADRFSQHWSDSPLAPRSAYFGAVSDMAAQHFPRAIARFERMLDRHANDPLAESARLMLAQCYQHENLLDKAVRHYRALTESSEADRRADALLGLATTLSRQGHHAEAGAAFEDFLKNYPKHVRAASAQFELGRCCFEDGRYDDAVKALRRAARQDESLADRCAYWTAKCRLRQDRFADAARLFGEAIDAHADSALLPEMTYDRAVALTRAADQDDAIETLRRFIARFADHALLPDALHLAAVIEHERGRYAESDEFCGPYLKRFTDQAAAADVALLRAENAFLAGDYARAAREYESFVEAHGDHPRVETARYRWGLALQRDGRGDDAAALLARASNADAQFAGGAMLALADVHMKKGAWSEAESVLARFVTQARDASALPDALLKLGLCRQRQNKHQDAIAALDRVIAEFRDAPQRPHALFERGQALVGLERRDDAATAFQTLLDQAADSRFVPHALNHLGTIAMQRGDPAAAANWFERLRDHAPDDAMRADAQLSLGRALLAAGRFADAESALDQFVDKFGVHPEATAARAQRAIALSRLDRFEDALKQIEHVEKKASGLDSATRSAVAYEKAWCLTKLGRSDEARTAYAGVDESDPALAAHALLEAARIEADAKRYDAALATLKRLNAVIEQTPDRVPADVRESAIYQHGVCAFEAGRNEEAAAAMATLIDRFTESRLRASASWFAGEALHRQGKFKTAAEQFKRIAESYADDDACGPSLLRLGECMTELQQWRNAERAFGDYLTRFADAPSWYQAQFGLGWARENQQRHEEAVSAYRAVTSRHKGATAARAQFQIGECLFAQKKYDDAVRELLKVDILYAYPEWSAAALYEAGRCLEALNRTAEARKQYETVTQRYGDSKWATPAKERLSAMPRDVPPGR